MSRSVLSLSEFGDMSFSSIIGHTHIAAEIQHTDKQRERERQTDEHGHIAAEIQQIDKQRERERQTDEHGHIAAEIQQTDKHR